ncbi:MAG: preprotein translocase subunit SecG [Candidatus Liptonbacteria bacterium]|nr:preprotein translocase subunit SecG [Candidatus Liptonbacteria bacterium]
MNSPLISSLLPFLQIGVSLALIVLILLQERSSGISLLASESTFYQTRRGLERVIFGATIVLAGLFAAISLLSLVL